MTPVRAHHYVRLIYFRFCDRPCDRIPCFLFSLERSARKHTHTQHIAHHALIHPSCTDGPIMPANAISMLTKIYSSITILTTHMMTWQRWVNTTTQPDCISGAVCVHVCECVIAVFASNHQASFCGFRIEHVYVVACIKPEMIWFFYLLLQRLCDGCVGRWHATMWMIWNVHVNMTMCMHPSIILTGRNRQQCDGVQQTVHNTANTAMTRIKFNCIYQCKCIFAFQYTITFNWNQNYQQFIILDSVHSVCVCVTNLISVPFALCCALKMFHHHGIWHSPH